jgi:hypothetical protein
MYKFELISNDNDKKVWRNKYYTVSQIISLGNEDLCVMRESENVPFINVEATYDLYNVEKFTIDTAP